MDNSSLFLIRSFAESNPEAAARALESLEVDEAAAVIAELPAAVAGVLLERLAPHAAGAIVGKLEPQTTRELLEHLTPRQAATVLQLLEPELREQLLSHGASETTEKLRRVLKYAPQTAGGIMDFPVTSLPVDLTVQEAIAQIRKAPRESIYYLYVTQRDGRLVGVVNTRDLLLAAPDVTLSSLVRTELTSVQATMDREDVATLMRQKGYLALPVVDDDQHLLGVVRHEQVLETVQQEAFEDLQKMVGAGGDESAMSPVGTVVKRRLPWLLVNLVTAFVASAVVGLFEGLIAQVAALAVLLPIVSGQGGNSGAQTLAVVIRGLALKEILPGRIWPLLRKELLAGFLNGILIAICTSAAVWLWSGNVGLALVIGLAMIVNMTSAGLAGAAIPLALRALGRDPAQSSSIFLTTVTDVVGFASFLGFAAMFLSWLK
jgi:magnesium transporter